MLEKTIVPLSCSRLEFLDWDEKCNSNQWEVWSMQCVVSTVMHVHVCIFGILEVLATCNISNEKSGHFG